MKSIVAYILIPLFLLNNSIGELFKLPDFFAHYSEHRQEDKSLGLFEFVDMHYGGTDLNEQDNERDAQLPFKNTEAPSSYDLLLLSYREAVVTSPDCNSEQREQHYVSAFLPDNVSARLIKPPASRCRTAVA